MEIASAFGLDSHYLLFVDEDVTGQISVYVDHADEGAISVGDVTRGDPHRVQQLGLARDNVDAKQAVDFVVHALHVTDGVVRVGILERAGHQLHFGVRTDVDALDVYEVEDGLVLDDCSRTANFDASS